MARRRRRRVRKNQGADTGLLLLGLAGVGGLVWYLSREKRNGAAANGAADCQRRYDALPPEAKAGPPGGDPAVVREMFMRHCAAIPAGKRDCFQAMTSEQPPSPECMAALQPFMTEAMEYSMQAMMSAAPPPGEGVPSMPPPPGVEFPPLDAQPPSSNGMEPPPVPAGNGIGGYVRG